MILEVISLTHAEVVKNGVSLQTHSRTTCQSFEEIVSNSNR